MPVSLTELTRVSALLGADTLLVQGAGGNTSEKIGETMWIKASGKWLAHACENDFFVPIKHRDLSKRLSDRHEPQMMDFVVGVTPLRPSIETALHVALPHRVVLHVHPVSVIAQAVRRDSVAKMTELLSPFNWAWVPYVKPGWGLAQAVARAYQDDNRRNVFVLGNHGLVVAAENHDEAVTLVRGVVAACDVPPRPLPAMNMEDVARACPPGMVVCSHSVSHFLALDPHAYALAAQGVLYPDQAVFLGASLATAMADGGVYAVLRDKGVYVRPDANPGVAEMLACHAEVARRLEPDAPLNPLAEAEIGALLNWDAEKYRQGKVS